MKNLVDEYSALPIVEIGPGQGDLTQHFIHFGRPITAIEIDPDSVGYLKEKFGNQKHLEIVQGDALKLLESKIPPHSEIIVNSSKNASVNYPQKNLENKEFILLANLPFNVGSRILVDLPICYPQAPLAVILQKEVAEKTRQDKDLTFFGAWLNLFWDLKVEFDIAPGNFYPPPKVYSSLLVGRPKFGNTNSKTELSSSCFQGDSRQNPARVLNYEPPSHLSTPQECQKTRELLKTLFGKPRKTIGNNLKGSNFENLASKIDPNERLTWANYQKILQNLLTSG